MSNKRKSRIKRCQDSHHILAVPKNDFQLWETNENNLDNESIVNVSKFSKEQNQKMHRDDERIARCEFKVPYYTSPHRSSSPISDPESPILPFTDFLKQFSDPDGNSFYDETPEFTENKRSEDLTKETLGSFTRNETMVQNENMWGFLEEGSPILKLSPSNHVCSTTDKNKKDTLFTFEKNIDTGERNNFNRTTSRRTDERLFEFEKNYENACSFLKLANEQNLNECRITTSTQNEEIWNWYGKNLNPNVNISTLDSSTMPLKQDFLNHSNKRLKQNASNIHLHKEPTSKPHDNLSIDNFSERLDSDEEFWSFLSDSPTYALNDVLKSLNDHERSPIVSVDSNNYCPKNINSNDKVIKKADSVSRRKGSNTEHSSEPNLSQIINAPCKRVADLFEFEQPFRYTKSTKLSVFDANSLSMLPEENSSSLNENLKFKTTLKTRNTKSSNVTSNVAQNLITSTTDIQTVPTSKTFPKKSMKKRFLNPKVNGKLKKQRSSSTAQHLTQTSNAVPLSNTPVETISFQRIESESIKANNAVNTSCSVRTNDSTVTQSNVTCNKNLKTSTSETGAKDKQGDPVYFLINQEPTSNNRKDSQLILMLNNGVATVLKQIPSQQMQLYLNSPAKTSTNDTVSIEKNTVLSKTGCIKKPVNENSNILRTEYHTLENVQLEKNLNVKSFDISSKNTFTKPEKNTGKDTQTEGKTNSNNSLTYINLPRLVPEDSVKNQVASPTCKKLNFTHSETKRMDFVQSKLSFKPKKSIPLGKNKNAIQQISSPMKVADVRKTQSIQSPMFRPIKSKTAEISRKSSLVESSTNNGCNAQVFPPVFATVPTSNMIQTHTGNLHAPSVFPTHLQGSLQFQSPTIINNATVATLQGLIPTPVTYFPVSLVPTATVLNAQYVPNNVLQNNTPVNTPQMEASIDPVTPATKEDDGKNVKTTAKNVGRKTVKQLLEERQKEKSKIYCDINLLSTGNGTLRTIQPPIMTSVKNDSYQNPQNRRPNILILPSSSKSTKKTVIKNDSLKGKLLLQNVNEISSTDYINDEKSKGEFKSRHYDMSELQIGNFKVTSDRYKSKFRVYFQRRQFVYEFPISLCNQKDLTSSQMWKQKAQILVPFQMVKQIDMVDRTIRVTVSGFPTVNLCRKQSEPTVDDMSWAEGIRSDLLHKVVLRQRQASNLKLLLCRFDSSFVEKTRINNLTRTSSGQFIAEEELSQANLKLLSKNKRTRTRRLPQWDPDTPNVDEPTSNQVCSCRSSCRSVRCSCVKAARSCDGSRCMCVNCDNPLNVLEKMGIDLDVALQDRCLFQSIYSIPNLEQWLQREILLICCTSIVRVKDCIPGIVCCPNPDCGTEFEFSWCRGIICFPDQSPRNHCSFCGMCCFKSNKHCQICNQCYAMSTQLPECPRCNESPLHSELHSVPKITRDSNVSNSAGKPEIILLDARKRDTICNTENKASNSETNVSWTPGGLFNSN